MEAGAAPEDVVSRLACILSVVRMLAPRTLHAAPTFLFAVASGFIKPC